MRNVRVVQCIVFVVFSLLVVKGMGCTSVPTYEQHLVLAEGTQLDLDKLWSNIVAKSKDPNSYIATHKREAYEMHLALVQLQHAYVDALVAYRMAKEIDPNASPEVLQAAYANFSAKVAELAPQYIQLGFNVYSYVKKISD